MQTFDLLLELEHISKTDPQVRPLNFCFVTPTAGSYSIELFFAYLFPYGQQCKCHIASAPRYNSC